MAAGNESEEFEFRLRSEREGGAKPSEPTIGPKDIPGPKALPPVKETGLSFPGSSRVGAGEAALSAGTGALGSVVGAGAGILHNLFGSTEGGRRSDHVAADIAQSMTYRPRTREGQEYIGGLAKFLDSSKLAGLGPAEGMALAGAPRPRVPVPSSVTSMEPKLTASARPDRGAGATRVLDEMQRARDTVEAGTFPSPGVPRSPVEKAGMGVSDATQKFKDVLGSTKDRIEVAPALDLIENQLKGKAIDPAVRSALETARTTIKQAIENEGGGTSVQMIGGRPLVLENGKLVPAPTKQPGVGIELADEIRQSLNRQINGRDSTGRPLDKFTQELLGKVRDTVVGKTPEPYQKSLTELSGAKKGMEAFDPKASVLGKVTSGEEGAARLAGTDAQLRMESVFTGKTPEAHLKELVALNGHSPEALNGLRTSYTEWLSAPDPKLRAPKSGDLLKKWDSTRQAVSESGLMTPEHIANVDRVMDDVFKQAKGGTLKKAWASTAGWVAGMATPHPFVAARAVREVAESSMKAGTAKALEAAMLQIAGTPEGAAVLAAPPSAQSVARVRAMLPTDVAALVVPFEAQAESRTRQRPGPLTMQPNVYTR